MGTSGLELGAMSMLMYCFREREQIMDLNEEISGFRMHTSYIRPGGVFADATPRFLEMLDAAGGFDSRPRIHGLVPSQDRKLVFPAVFGDQETQLVC